MDLYYKVVQMRKRILAPVDTDGCDKHDTDNLDEKNFAILVSLILSSRTKDEKVGEAMMKIKKNIGFNWKKLSDASDNEILNCINGVNFVNNKLKYLKKSSTTIANDFKGVVPKDRKSLMSLDGVGPKTADLYLLKAEESTEEISIDTHCMRIFQRWGWVKDSKNTNQVSKEMKDWFPEVFRKDLFQIVVGFGQNICGAAKNCDFCPINDKCPSSSVSPGKVPDIEDILKFTKDKREKLNFKGNDTWIVPDEKGEPVSITTNWK